MHHFILFLLLINSFCSLAQQIDLKDVRANFNQGVKNKTLCVKYYEHLKKNAQTPVEMGYKAAFHMFMATHTFNPIKKMSYFKTARNMLEEVIETNPQDVELRFIRLCLQYYSPKFLNYDHQIAGDKEFVMHNLHKLKDKQAKQTIYRYLHGAKMYSQEELALLGR